MIEVHGESFTGEYKWQVRAGTGDIVRLSLGTSDFCRISERDAFERIKSVLGSAGLHWITPDPSGWTFQLQGLHNVIGTQTDLSWLIGKVNVKPEFSSNYTNVAGTYVGTADFVFYFSPQATKSGQANISRETVFVCYSHADVKWLERLKVHLKPLERSGHLDVFDDTKIQPGLDWRKEIHFALQRATVAVLLISADFLASDFIADNELPPLLAKAEAGGARIIPLIVSPSRFSKTESLFRYQAINDPQIPLERMGRAGSEDVLVRVAEAVFNALEGTAKPTT